MAVGGPSGNGVAETDESNEDWVALLAVGAGEGPGTGLPDPNAAPVLTWDAPPTPKGAQEDFPLAWSSSASPEPLWPVSGTSSGVFQRGVFPGGGLSAALAPSTGALQLGGFISWSAHGGAGAAPFGPAPGVPGNGASFPGGSVSEGSLPERAACCAAPANGAQNGVAAVGPKPEGFSGGRSGPPPAAGSGAPGSVAPPGAPEVGEPWGAAPAPAAPPAEGPAGQNREKLPPSGLLPASEAAAQEAQGLWGTVAGDGYGISNAESVRPAVQPAGEAPEGSLFEDPQLSAYVEMLIGSSSEQSSLPKPMVADPAAAAAGVGVESSECEPLSEGLGPRGVASLVQAGATAAGAPAAVARAPGVAKLAPPPVTAADSAAQAIDMMKN